MNERAIIKFERLFDAKPSTISVRYTEPNIGLPAHWQVSISVSFEYDHVQCCEWTVQLSSREQVLAFCNALCSSILIVRYNDPLNHARKVMDQVERCISLWGS